MIGKDLMTIKAAFMRATAPNDTLSTPLADINTAIAVNLTSAFVAAQEAVAGFEKLPADVPRSFIYTGNCLNKPMSPLLSLGMPKAAAAHMIHSAAISYTEKGYQ
jgi:NAD(P)-dependent dehydrogenase (short-subunit alcohol dehydrogenase family)